MEILLFFLALALLVLILRLMTRMTEMSRDLAATREQMAAFMRTMRSSEGGATRPSQSAPAGAAPVRTKPAMDAPVASAAPRLSEPSVTPAPVGKPELDEQGRRLAAMLESFHEEPTRPVTSSHPIPISVEGPGNRSRQTTASASPPPVTPRPPEPTFWVRNPDLEKFIGENLMNKIGITVLVIGIGLLLRYAIDRELISETAQTMIGLLAGGALVFFAHRVRRSFRAFSSVLVAGGIAVFYFTIATAFHQYQIIGQSAAFVTMVAITGVAVLLTLAYDRKELAVISLLGGFATPFMVSTGEGNFKVLFTYLLILNAGMLVLSNFKKWHIINVISFVLTLFLFGGWLLGPYEGVVPPPTLPAFGFATAFFLVFFGMNLRYNLRHRQAFLEIDHALLLVNTAAYYGAGMLLLSDLTVRVSGLFTVLLGLFYLLFALYFHRREGIPSSLKFMLIGLVLTFISLAAPVQLEGNHITLFWAAEAVLLLWFSQRTGLRLVERASVLVTALMIGSLWMDLFDIYSYTRAYELTPLLNKGWITGVAVAISLGLGAWLLRKSDQLTEILPGLSRKLWAVIITVLGVGVLFVVNYLEIRHQLERVFLSEVVDMVLMGWLLFYLLVVDFFLRTKQGWQVVPAVCMTFSAMVYISAFYSSSRIAFNAVNSGMEASGAFVFHYVAVLLMGGTLFRIIQFTRKNTTRKGTVRNVHFWAISIFLVIFSSQELDHVMVLGGGSVDALSAGRRIGYPMLWGIGSFVFMWLGMRGRLRVLRVISLSLFGLTLVKLFLFDLGSLSEGGRVAAFIFLGALLLVISFMYQKLKGLVMADGPETTIDDDTW